MALSKAEIVANSMTLIVAGSDPVSTVLAGALNPLFQKPEALNRLVFEVRTSFQSETDISATLVRRLSYLTAVLQEALRQCPLTPDSMRRAMPKGGATIAGNVLPRVIAVGGLVMQLSRQWPTSLRLKILLQSDGLSAQIRA